MKIAPFIRAIREFDEVGEAGILRPNHRLIHTGQHYDAGMSHSFFRALNIPDPDVNLEVGSGSHAEQVGKTMIVLEKVLRREKPDWVVVVGDVNATLAASVTAKKEGIRLCHIEAGLRSGDISMPEEVNRLVTDRLADLLLTPDRLSSENLRHEGAAEERIVFVGNIMIDTLEANREKAAEINPGMICSENGLTPSRKVNGLSNGEYGIITLHRPSNVDDPAVLGALVSFFCDEATAIMPLIWPVHPRAEKRLKEFGYWEKICGLRSMILLQPIGYREMLRLNMGARLLLTDSGGLQEECTVLGTPCLTLRWNTERPITLRDHGGASVLVGNDVNRIRAEFHSALMMDRKPTRPELWDGHAAARCLQAILDQ